MKPPQRSNKNKNRLENDDSGSEKDFSSGSGDEWMPDKSDNPTLEKNQNSLQKSDDDDNDNVDVPFNTTAGFSLKIVKNYKMSKHPVWMMFGYLMKDNKLVTRVKDKFFCKSCYDKKNFKR